MRRRVPGGFLGPPDGRAGCMLRRLGAAGRGRSLLLSARCQLGTAAVPTRSARPSQPRPLRRSGLGPTSDAKASGPDTKPLARPSAPSRLCLTIVSWNSQALFKARETLLLLRMQPGWFRSTDYQTEPSPGAGGRQHSPLPRILDIRRVRYCTRTWPLSVSQWRDPPSPPWGLGRAIRRSSPRCRSARSRRAPRRPGSAS